MDWFTGSKQGEVKKLIAQLADVTKRDRAAQDLIRIDEDVAPLLIEALQTKDANLLPVYQEILARIPSATPSLIKTLNTAHPLIRGRVAEVFAINKDRNAVPALLEALQGEYFTVRSRAALALGKISDTKAIQPLLHALKDQEDEVRIAACLALGLFKDPSTFDDLTNVLLDDPKIEVRQAAGEHWGTRITLRRCLILWKRYMIRSGGMSVNMLQVIYYQRLKNWALQQSTRSLKRCKIRKGLFESLRQSCSAN